MIHQKSFDELVVEKLLFKDDLALAEIYYRQNRIPITWQAIEELFPLEEDKKDVLYCMLETEEEIQKFKEIGFCVITKNKLTYLAEAVLLNETFTRTKN